MILGVVASQNSGATPTTLLEFDVTNTTAGNGTLTNVTGSDWTVTRSTIGTVMDVNDDIVEIAINYPRIDYHTGSPAMLIEEETENYAPNSTTFLNWTTGAITLTTTAIDSPVDSVTYMKMTQSTTTQNSGVNKWMPVLRDAGVTASRSFTVSVYYYHTIRQDFAIRVAGANGTYIEDEDFIVDMSTGDIPRRASVTKTFTSDGDATRIEMYLYIGDHQTATSNLFSYVTAIQVEEGTTATSYMPNLNNSTYQIRGADSITNTVPTGGTNMETWINGVSDGGVSVTAGNTITMVNGTTKIIVT